MADGKKSFIAYCDWEETFNALPDDKAGQLIKHLLAYVNDRDPDTQDVLITAVFANIKHTLKRDLKRYEYIREKRSKAGIASGLKREQTRTKRTNVKSVEQTRTKRTDSVSVSDIKELYIEFLSFFYSVTNKKCTGTKKDQSQFNARIKEGKTINDFKKAIYECFNDKFHKENLKYLTPEFITRADKLERYMNINPNINFENGELQDTFNQRRIGQNKPEEFKGFKPNPNWVESK
jgi:uncharacterized phage protein (TIGR02220 family)